MRVTLRFPATGHFFTLLCNLLLRALFYALRLTRNICCGGLNCFLCRALLRPLEAQDPTHLDDTDAGEAGIHGSKSVEPEC